MCSLRILSMTSSNGVGIDSRLLHDVRKRGAAEDLALKLEQIVREAAIRLRLTHRHRRARNKTRRQGHWQRGEF